MCGKSSLALAFAVALAVLTSPCGDRSVRAQDAGTSNAVEAQGAVGAQGAPDEPATRRPEVIALETTTDQVRSFARGELDVAIDPRTLFEVRIDDETAVQLEAARVRALLSSLEPPAKLEPQPKKSKRNRKGEPVPEPLVSPAQRAIEGIDPELWAARLELDRARLELYALGKDERDALIANHMARKAASTPTETDEQRRARHAEAERERALAAARAARSEAERMVSEELARLIALDAEVTAVRAGIEDEVAALLQRKDAVLGWQRRVRDIKRQPAPDVDAAYDALRRALHAARDDLSRALDALSAQQSRVPALGPDPLVDVPPDIPMEQVQERRALVARSIAGAQEAHDALRKQRTRVLLHAIDVLNRERLSLLPFLSADKRDAVTGFTTEGLGQAASEARHLSLILRDHQHLALDWIDTLRAGGKVAVSPWRIAAVLVPLLLFTLFFMSVRSRTPQLFKAAELRAIKVDRMEHRALPSPQRRLASVVRKVHRPLEWFAFFLGSVWLLPRELSGLLEVQLLASVIGWILGGKLVVSVIDAVVARRSDVFAREDTSAELRLRSLRLVGRTVVGFALILIVSSRMVGRGTIYSWVFSTCWFAAIPVFLVLVRWWRGTVFARIERVRKQTPFEQWVLSNRSGWQSFLAAMLGAVHLFTSGAYKMLRTWLSTFDIARRAHAYLFRRELARLDDQRKTMTMAPLDPATLEVLHPERPMSRWLPCPADEPLAQLTARAERRQGGVVALIGVRGMGKSSLLKALKERVPSALELSCAEPGFLDQARALRRQSESESLPPLILLEDAQALVKPLIGGLAAFDELIGIARTSCTQATWVLTINAAVWPFLRRARDARPLFDETIELRPWNENQIGALLAERNAQAGIDPSYEDLLEALPAGSDEIDRLDALAARKAGYERMLWDHVRGNPALALEAFRASLVRSEGGVVHVRPLQVPEVTRLDLLPDSSLFILRAVLQLAPARVDDVAQATRLTPEQVINALRFGETHGFLRQAKDGRIYVTWRWLHAVSRLLERRHLLVNA